MLFSNKKVEYESDLRANYRAKNYNVSTTLGYFLVNNLLLGITGSLKSDRVKTNEQKSQEIGLMTKYYVGFSYTFPLKLFLYGQVGYGKKTDKLYLYTDVNNFATYYVDDNLPVVPSFVRDLKETLIETTESKSVFYSYKFGGGFSYFVKNKISFDLNLFYVIDYLAPRELNSKRDTSTITGFEPSLGISLYL